MREIPKDSGRLITVASARTVGNYGWKPKGGEICVVDIHWNDRKQDVGSRVHSPHREKSQELTAGFVNSSDLKIAKKQTPPEETLASQQPSLSILKESRRNLLSDEFFSVS